MASHKVFINFVGQSSNQLIIKIMGKGDKKSRRGKIVIKSFGVKRPRKKSGRAMPEKMKEEPVIAQKVKPPAKAKQVEEVPVEMPVMEISPEVAEKPAKKKPAAKAKPAAKQKEEKSE